MLYTPIGGLGTGLSVPRCRGNGISAQAARKSQNSNHTIMKRTLIALMALAGVAAADTATTPEELTWTDLTITTPAGASLTTSNSAINWSDSVENLVNSWELSFTLDPSRLSNQYLFGTTSSGTGAASYTLQITNAGKIRLNSNKSTELLTVGTYTADDSAVAITLQFVKFVDTEGTFQSGRFTLTVGGETGTYDVTSDANTVFVKGDNSKLWTNSGNEQFSNISLKYADSVVVQTVPEPTAAAFSLLALAGLAARRRRK